MAAKMLLSFIFFAAFGYAAPYAHGIVRQDTSAVDSVKVPVPDYEDVNVLVETDWGTKDKTEKVDVFINRKKGKYTELVLKKSDHQECFIELVPGMVVKIIDRKSGRVVKTFKP